MRAKNEYKFISEAYQHVLLENSLESILPSLQFKETTKQAKQYQYTDSSQNMPAMSYTVVETQQPVVTVTSDGKETQNVAEPNDIIMSGPSREQYVVKPEKFPKLYTGKIGGTVTPEQSPRIVARVDNIDQPITFKAPWGEDMILKQGDYLVKDADQGYYRIAQKEYDETYNALGEDNESYDDIRRRGGHGDKDDPLWQRQMDNRPKVSPEEWERLKNKPRPKKTGRLTQPKIEDNEEPRRGITNIEHKRDALVAAGGTKSEDINEIDLSKWRDYPAEDVMKAVYRQYGKEIPSVDSYDWAITWDKKVRPWLKNKFPDN